MSTNIFKRFLEIWKPSFIKNIIKEEKAGPSWGFWFFWNSVVALIATIIVAFIINGGVNLIQDTVNDKVDDDAKIEFNDGVLTTTNIDEPIFVSDSDDSVFVMDTKGLEYDESILDDYNEGVYITSDKLVSKQNSYETTTFDYTQINNDFSFTGEKVKDTIDNFKGGVLTGVFILMFVGIWLFYNVFRLVSALWWALLAWVVGGPILKIKGFTYGKAYLAVLNMYLIPLLIEFALLLLIVGWFIPFQTTTIFIIFFGINFWYVKKENGQSKPVEESKAIPEPKAKKV